ncbi:MAG: site-2 protease family protein [Candidatus Yanofskybacteria bacterium CG10_big_fil_rev_8_21_14_0_10_36_16]|uniref:Site-2 protease family protein n=1 Tax=Candidatus Yanofskybacteria bacterium CG10_big_fil_rev_8_21_14_0_10_36_16 TaxID=1975096 RepID=A0A2J0QAQ8_9BACT|nr:MAG: site-2 protease family protein [Candidatus Yanofskybacteria bacterium CG10_big_fil_rev_8_21_14_0_10_36_16]
MFGFSIFLYLVIIFSAVFHEFMHGWMANYLGDPTAKYAGRLTLNPLKHIDPLGTVIIPLLLLLTVGGFIGWAKPVPYNPMLLSDRKYGSAKVGFAGPGANFMIALVFGIFIRFVAEGTPFYLALSWVIYINIFLALFNLIPVPPLDGSKLLMDFFPRARFAMMQLSFLGIFFALIIAVMILPQIAQGFYWLFTGASFTELTF